MKWKRWPRPSRLLGTLLLLLLAALLYPCARWILLHPRTDRDWVPPLAVVPEIRIDGPLVHITNIRNFTYGPNDAFTPDWYDRTFDLDRITTVDFVLSPFRDNWRGPAHGFLSFGFADSQYVAISVEARKEIGEDYSVWKGLVHTYELCYVIGDERDLIGLRAVHWRDGVHLYPLVATQQQIRDLFVDMLLRARELTETPEFYNTALSNCTTNLYDHARALSPDAWSWSWKLLLPGYADEMIFERGLVDTELSLEEARKRYLVNEAAVRFLDDPAFSIRIRE